jgi:class 3 adenylate cyclase
VAVSTSVDAIASDRDHPRVTTEAHERPRSDRPTGRVTFQFSDIEGSTRLRQHELTKAGRSMDPEAVFLADDLAGDVS